MYFWQILSKSKRTCVVYQTENDLEPTLNITGREVLGLNQILGPPELLTYRIITFE